MSLVDRMLDDVPSFIPPRLDGVGPFRCNVCNGSSIGARLNRDGTLMQVFCRECGNTVTFEVRDATPHT